jgi:hypothetical protein
MRKQKGSWVTSTHDPRSIAPRSWHKPRTLGAIVFQRQHDGQDTVYVASNRSRQEVRAEAIQSAQSRRAGNVNDLYFGA